MRILVTGGAGYLGTVLTHLLLQKGHSVRVFDSLLYGVRPIVPFFHYRQFSFHKGDIRDEDSLQKAADGCDTFVHLAAIVGYPACERDPELAEAVNVQGTANLCRAAGADGFLFFASTGSCYGAVHDEICTEKTALNPVSQYGQTKVKAEEIVLSGGNATVYRFATVYGVSPRLRLDLLINNFVYRALRENRLEIYEANANRTFIHVNDVAKSILFALENRQTTDNKVFNVGDESQNLTKRRVCELIRAEIPSVEIDYAASGRDFDARDYIVSYQKIKKAGFTTEIPVHRGIKELAEALRWWTEGMAYTNV